MSHNKSTVFRKKKLLGVEVGYDSEKDILEKIKKVIENPKEFYHVVSINPENVIISQKTRTFREVIGKAQIKINDGVGIVVASQILGLGTVPRLTGMDLMDKLLNMASERRIRVVFIGGKGNLAEEMSDCYNHAYAEAKSIGVQGIKDIRNYGEEESKKLISIVTDYKPRLLFVAFGSPDQELWLYKNRPSLKGIVCMGVGGGFDFATKRVKRAPKLLRHIGLEWLFRLFLQPWRVQRQLTRLPYFIWLVVKERFSKKRS